MKLNTPQITLAKLVQSGRHETVTQEVQSSWVTGSIRTEIISLSKQYKNDNIDNFMYLQENSIDASSDCSRERHRYFCMDN